MKVAHGAVVWVGLAESRWRGCEKKPEKKSGFAKIGEGSDPGY